jgi:hypothetical protein
VCLTANNGCIYGKKSLCTILAYLFMRLLDKEPFILRFAADRESYGNGHEKMPWCLFGAPLSKKVL